MLQTRLECPWSARQGFKILLTFTLLYFSLSAGHMMWVKSTIGFEHYLKSDTDFYTKVLIFGQSIKALAIFVSIWWVGLKGSQLNWSALGFRKTTLQWVLIAISLAVAGFVLRLLLMKWFATEMPQWVRFMQPPLKDLSLNGITLMVFLLLTVLITPIVEEIFFRGFLFQWMAGRKPVWLAAMISSMIFGVSHIVPPQAVAAALMSLLITGLFVLSRSIWPAIICHVVNNALSIAGNLLASAELLPNFLAPPAVG